jgi:hypothetical protein
MGLRLASFFVLVMMQGAVAGLCGAAEALLSGCRWETMARRSPGFVVGASRWDAGTLAVRDEKVLWVDARDPGRNVIVPLSRLAGHSLACGDGPAASVCTEWRLRTRREEYRFRDLVSGPTGSPRLIEIHDYVRSVLADLSAVSPTDRR